MSFSRGSWVSAQRTQAGMEFASNVLRRTNDGVPTIASLGTTISDKCGPKW